MDVTTEMHGWYRDPDVELPTTDPDGTLDVSTHQEIRRNYAAMCENVDRWLGRYLDCLREHGALDDTIVVYSSDHGELLGDHGGWGKWSPRRASAGVPLTVAGPGIEPRGRVNELAALLDVHSTLLDVAGVPSDAADGRSLWPYLAGDTAAHRDVVRCGLDPWRLAFDGRYVLVRGFDRARAPNLSGDLWAWCHHHREDDRYVESVTQQHHAECEPILFDRVTDPAERHNVADEHPAVVDRLTPHASLDA